MSGQVQRGMRKTFKREKYKLKPSCGDRVRFVVTMNPTLSLSLLFVHRKPRYLSRVWCVKQPVCWLRRLTTKTTTTPWTSSAAAAVWWPSRSKLSAPQVLVTFQLVQLVVLPFRPADEFISFSTGARLNCDSCGKNSVPAYHLAMSDTSIRNFCRLQCVMAFQVIQITVCKMQKKREALSIFCTIQLALLQKLPLVFLCVVGEVQEVPQTHECFHQVADWIHANPAGDSSPASAVLLQRAAEPGLRPVRPQHHVQTRSHPDQGVLSVSTSRNRKYVFTAFICYCCLIQVSHWTVEQLHFQPCDILWPLIVDINSVRRRSWFFCAAWIVLRNSRGWTTWRACVNTVRSRRSPETPKQ